MTSPMSHLKGDHRRLFSTQCRLRHLRTISARHVVIPEGVSEGIHHNHNGLYFTMHFSESAPAIYKSEIQDNTENPNWKIFNWPSLSEEIVTSLPSVIVKVWFTLNTKKPLIQQKVFFKNLEFVGEQIPKDGIRFHPNSLIFEVFEGFYACSTIWKGCVSQNVSVDKPLEIEVKKSTVQKSYNLSNLKRVHTVQRAIKETKAAVHRIRTSINAKLLATLEKSEMVTERKLLQVRLEQLREELNCHRQSLFQAQERSSYMTEENRMRALHLDAEAVMLRKNEEQLLEQRKTLIDSREQLIKTTAQLALRRRQLVAELGFVYPIHEVANKGYTICGVHLPNSEDFHGQDELMISTALGYVCHLVSMISQFHQVPLRYPVTHGGSHSKIYDFFLSTIPDSERQFPLYTRGMDKLHFKYGVYLLNKNISQLRFYCGFNTFDLRCTLGNLKTLLELGHITKTEPSTPVAVTENIIHNSSPRDVLRFDEDPCGSTDSLNLDMLRHKRPLWKPSPECCRTSATSVSLDHGLDELESGPPSTMTVSSTSAELRMSEPFFLNSRDVQSCEYNEHHTPAVELLDNIVLAPFKLYSSESETDENQVLECAKPSLETFRVAPT